MIGAEQRILIGAPIEGVWDYVKDIERWANLMPGLRECKVIGANDSQWTLKVGVGALVRAVNVLVHVDKWDGPERVSFSYRLAGDPVEGDGTYTAICIGPDQTEVTLNVRVVGTGPMAPMWEAMGKPLLPKFAQAFADQLKAEIEQAVHAQGATDAARMTPAAAPAPTPGAHSMNARLLQFLRRMFGSGTAKALNQPERLS